MFLDIGLGVWNLKHSDLVAENSPWIPLGFRNQVSTGKLFHRKAGTGWCKWNSFGNPINHPRFITIVISCIIMFNIGFLISLTNQLKTSRLRYSVEFDICFWMITWPSLRHIETVNWSPCPPLKVALKRLRSSTDPARVAEKWKGPEGQRGAGRQWAARKCLRAYIWYVVNHGKNM